MRHIQYKKTQQGLVVTKDQEMDTNHQPESRIERFDAFFQNVPLWGGKEWETLTVDEIVSIFLGAADDIYEVWRQRHDEALLEHSTRNALVRWWKELRGWKAPPLYSRKEIITSMVARCEDLSLWVRQNSSRRFYMDSDMSVFIQKPAEVAKRLADT